MYNIIIVIINRNDIIRLMIILPNGVHIYELAVNRKRNGSRQILNGFGSFCIDNTVRRQFILPPPMTEFVRRPRRQLVL